MDRARYREVTAGRKGGERLVLALIAMCADEDMEADVDGLCLDTGLSAKQVLRITTKLKTDGVIIVKGGTGRAPDTFTLASANADKMSSQITQDVPSAVATQNIMSSQEIGSQDKMSPLADAATKCPDNEACSEDKKS